MIKEGKLQSHTWLVNLCCHERVREATTAEHGRESTV